MANSLIKKLFNEGIADRMEEFSSQESTKVGNLRGGSAGILSPDGKEVVGTCPRRAYLRMKGIKVEDAGASRELMFAAGRLNEDSWMDALKRSWKGPILAEEDVPTSWKTSNGIAVTGRPDIVLCDWKGGKEPPGNLKSDAIKELSVPKVGIELKLVSSLWTARDVLFEGKPKFNHLIQAAHYSWQLGIPFELWYTSRADYVTNDIANRCLPKYGSEKWGRLSKHLDFRYYKKVMSRNGNVYGKQIKEDEFKKEEAAGNFGWREGQVYVSPLKIFPFSVGYALNWELDGRLSYQSTEFGEKFITRITRDSIKDFYEFVSTMEQTDELGPKPLTLKGDESKANFSMCGYCPLEDTCNSSKGKGPKGLAEWTAEVQAKKELK